MKRFACLALSCALMGCGSGHLPQSQTAEAQSEIRAAEVVGAEQHPQAALHLKLAKQQLDEAKELARDDEMERAQLTLQRARVDAELAIALSMEAEAEREARAALSEIKELSKR